MYTAAPHCHCTDTPGTEELKIPLQVGEIPPPGKLVVTGKARPVRKISSLPDIGTVVVQVPLLNVVVSRNRIYHPATRYAIH